MISPSPRLWIVVARRWRWLSTRALASARSAPIALNATPSASISFGPPASTRAPRSPDDIRRVATTRSSSGRRIVRISSVRKVSTPPSASPAPSTIATSAVRERSWAVARASSRRACWRAAICCTAVRTAGRSRAAAARAAAPVGREDSAAASRCAGAIRRASARLAASSSASRPRRVAPASKLRAALCTKRAARRLRDRTRLASSATLEARRFAAETSSAEAVASSSS
jgi:hypothetical protein